MKKVLKYIVILFLLFVAGISLMLWGLYCSADMKVPAVRIDTAAYALVDHGHYRECEGNVLRRSMSGLWEVYLHGDAADRGAALGRLTEDLLYYQEKVFVDQIREFVPSDRYLRFLRFMLLVFNRDLGEHVPEEFREEIWGIAQSCTHEFDAIGTPYERQLNYHAAHDIGHMMQQYMLVGCTSFAAWGPQTADGDLLVGRNFDFYMGDDFAHNKVVMFYAPAEGHKFASVSWPGMIGVLSGMNDAGLTVSINAAKGAMPTSAATPISILAREILQYAATIDEAMAIAERRRTFVSESLLVASAQDGRAAVIEKTPKKTALYTPDGTQVVCANHFQSDAFARDKYNVENIADSDSPLRQARVEELLAAAGPLDAGGAAAILRDRCGPGGSDVGLCNEMSINQSIAHHAVIFRPARRQMWVSTHPWQSGPFVCYNLDRVFAAPGDLSWEVVDVAQEIPADSVFMANEGEHHVALHRMMTFRVNEAAAKKYALPDDYLADYIANNPNHFGVHRAVAKYHIAHKNYAAARTALERALACEIPRRSERTELETLLHKCSKK